MQYIHGIAPYVVSVAKEISAPKEEIKQLLNLLEKDTEQSSEDGADNETECSEGMYIVHK
jgi:hypothetical protein